MDRLQAQFTHAAASGNINVTANLHRLYRTATDTQLALWATIAFTLVRLLLSLSTGFGVDESYTLSISRDLAGSYFDHPPLHLWIAHVSQTLFGHGRLERLPFVALSFATSWLMFRFTASLFGSRAALWSVLAFNLSGFFTLAAGEWVLPDGPLNFCLLAAAMSASKIVTSKFEVGDAREHDFAPWIAIGFWIGVAALAKYHALLFGIGLLGFFAINKSQRHWWRRPEPYAALALAVALFVPVLVWNGQHHWISVIFHLGRGGLSHGLHLDQFLAQIAGETIFLSAWLAVPLAIVTVRTIAKRDASDGEKLCLWLGVPNILLFTLTPLWAGRGMPHWPMPGWLMIFPLLGAWMAAADKTRLWPRRLITASFILYVSISLFLVSDGATGWVGATLLKTPSDDPTVELADWNAVPEFLADKGLLARSNTFLLAMDWQNAGKMDQAVQGKLAVHVFPGAAHAYAFRDNPGGKTGQDAIVIGTPARFTRHHGELARQFRNLTRIGQITIGRHGHPEIALDVYLASGLVHPLDVKAL